MHLSCCTVELVPTGLGVSLLRAGFDKLLQPKNLYVRAELVPLVWGTNIAHPFGEHRGVVFPLFVKCQRDLNNTVTGGKLKGCFLSYVPDP